jgi:hypothetical protein
MEQMRGQMCAQLLAVIEAGQKEMDANLKEVKASY